MGPSLRKGHPKCGYQKTSVTQCLWLPVFTLGYHLTDVVPRRAVVPLWYRSISHISISVLGTFDFQWRKTFFMSFTAVQCWEPIVSECNDLRHKWFHIAFLAYYYLAYISHYPRRRLFITISVDQSCLIYWVKEGKKEGQEKGRKKSS